MLQKQPPRNFITKKPDPTIPFESNYLENDHEAIVSRDVLDAVQKKLEENKKMEEVIAHLLCFRTGDDDTPVENGAGGLFFYTQFTT